MDQVTYPVDIYITSWLRPELTQRTIDLIHRRTKAGSFKIHVLDNQTSERTNRPLIALLEAKLINSLILLNENTRCLFGKLVFYAMTESSKPYFVITDNDIMPPKLEPDWLHQMVDKMERHPTVGMLTLQHPPTDLFTPLKRDGDVVICQAVGNTFKMVRRVAYPLPPDGYDQRKDSYGDDSLICKFLEKKGYQTAFCYDLYCQLMDQVPGYGYSPEELEMDPRKQGYGGFLAYQADPDTLRPPEALVYKG